jgi:Ni/Co efflux regulator RcnB
MNRLIASLAAALLFGTLSPAAQAHGPEHRDGHRFVARAYHHDHAHDRRDLRRAHRRAHRHAYRHHRDYDRRWHRRHRVLRHARGHRCRIDYRHYHRGVAYYGDLEDIVLGAIAYGIVREALD